MKSLLNILIIAVVCLMIGSVFNQEATAADAKVSNQMINIEKPIKITLSVPTSENNQKVDFKITESDSSAEILFTYPPIGVTPPVTTTRTVLTYLKNVHSKDDILKHYQENVYGLANYKLDIFKQDSGTVFVLAWEGIPQGRSTAYILSKDGLHGAIYIDYITNLKFDWRTVSIEWP